MAEPGIIDVPAGYTPPVPAEPSPPPVAPPPPAEPVVPSGDAEEDRLARSIASSPESRFANTRGRGETEPATAEPAPADDSDDGAALVSAMGANRNVLESFLNANPDVVELLPHQAPSTDAELARNVAAAAEIERGRAAQWQAAQQARDEVYTDALSELHTAEQSRQVHRTATVLAQQLGPDDPRVGEFLNEWREMDPLGAQDWLYDMTLAAQSAVETRATMQQAAQQQAAQQQAQTRNQQIAQTLADFLESNPNAVRLAPVMEQHAAALGRTADTPEQLARTLTEVHATAHEAKRAWSESVTAVGIAQGSGRTVDRLGNLLDRFGRIVKSAEEMNAILAPEPNYAAAAERALTPPQDPERNSELERQAQVRQQRTQIAQSVARAKEEGRTGPGLTTADLDRWNNQSRRGREQSIVEAMNQAAEEAHAASAGNAAEIAMGVPADDPGGFWAMYARSEALRRG